jgi:hypothetical protein
MGAGKRERKPTQDASLFTLDASSEMATRAAQAALSFAWVGPASMPLDATSFALSILDIH